MKKFVTESYFYSAPTESGILPQKPRRRKQSGSKTKYVVTAIVIVLVAAVAAWYLYSATPSTATTTSASTSSASASSTSSSANPIYAIVNTTKGSFEIELFPSSAPKTVANFVSLAKSGFYDNLVWHRIVNSTTPYVIQTGDPQTRDGGGSRSLWGTGGSNTTVPLEIDPSLHNSAGYLGMARGQDPNSGSSQFYINVKDNTYLDGSYTVFGKVISGMSVVDALANTPVYTSGQYRDQPITPVYVISIMILNGGP
jgi:cyclophilin family peptidyl-prolyl cis-trans isomerase